VRVDISILNNKSEHKEYTLLSYLMFIVVQENYNLVTCNY